MSQCCRRRPPVVRLRVVWFVLTQTAPALKSASCLYSSLWRLSPGQLGWDCGMLTNNGETCTEILSLLAVNICRLCFFLHVRVSVLHVCCCELKVILVGIVSLKVPLYYYHFKELAGWLLPSPCVEWNGQICCFSWPISHLLILPKNKLLCCVFTL